MMFEIRNGAVQLGDWVVFEGLNLRVEPGEIVSILGPSGCGKTTLLRASCGLERLKEGQRLLNDEVLENATIVPIITMLFQQPVLYPHLNVAQNIGLGAPKTMSKMAVKQRVDDVLQSIGLADFQRRGTAGLSGGEAQRVAFGRALMQEPTVMLLDEPFASVDVKRRLELSAMTRSHLKERNITTVHVTHDMEEAKTLSDRIVHWHELAVGAQEGVLDGEK
ncbi:MAG TPA: ATP-binding cassette domain-containing protein [Candidatus Poseidonia sp.]|nr:ATP-binding cassette domain-containing protein [Poseidonia sp.]